MRPGGPEQSGWGINPDEPNQTPPLRPLDDDDAFGDPPPMPGASDPASVERAERTHRILHALGHINELQDTRIEDIEFNFQTDAATDVSVPINTINRILSKPENVDAHEISDYYALRPALNILLHIANSTVENNLHFKAITAIDSLCSLSRSLQPFSMRIRPFNLAQRQSERGIVPGTPEPSHVPFSTPPTPWGVDPVQEARNRELLAAAQDAVNAIADWTPPAFDAPDSESRAAHNQLRQNLNAIVEFFRARPSYDLIQQIEEHYNIDKAMEVLVRASHETTRQDIFENIWAVAGWLFGENLDLKDRYENRLAEQLTGRPYTPPRTSPGRPAGGPRPQRLPRWFPTFGQRTPQNQDPQEFEEPDNIPPPPPAAPDTLWVAPEAQITDPDEQTKWAERISDKAIGMLRTNPAFKEILPLAKIRDKDATRKIQTITELQRLISASTNEAHERALNRLLQEAEHAALLDHTLAELKKQAENAQRNKERERQPQPQRERNAFKRAVKAIQHNTLQVANSTLNNDIAKGVAYTVIAAGGAITGASAVSGAIIGGIEGYKIGKENATRDFTQDPRRGGGAVSVIQQEIMEQSADAAQKLAAAEDFRLRPDKTALLFNALSDPLGTWRQVEANNIAARELGRQTERGNVDYAAFIEQAAYAQSAYQRLIESDVLKDYNERDKASIYEQHAKLGFILAAHKLKLANPERNGLSPSERAQLITDALASIPGIESNDTNNPQPLTRREQVADTYVQELQRRKNRAARAHVGLRTLLGATFGGATGLLGGNIFNFHKDMSSIIGTSLVTLASWYTGSWSRPAADSMTGTAQYLVDSANALRHFNSKTPSLHAGNPPHGLSKEQQHAYARNERSYHDLLRSAGVDEANYADYPVRSETAEDHEFVVTSERYINTALSGLEGESRNKYHTAEELTNLILKGILLENLETYDPDFDKKTIQKVGTFPAHIIQEYREIFAPYVSAQDANEMLQRAATPAKLAELYEALRQTREAEVQLGIGAGKDAQKEREKYTSEIKEREAKGKNRLVLELENFRPDPAVNEITYTDPNTDEEESLLSDYKEGQANFNDQQQRRMANLFHIIMSGDNAALEEFNRRYIVVRRVEVDKQDPDLRVVYHRITNRKTTD